MERKTYDLTEESSPLGPAPAGPDNKIAIYFTLSKLKLTGLPLVLVV